MAERFWGGISLGDRIVLSGDDLAWDSGIHKEWLLTNQIGGFASSTVLGVNTRRYHGLLLAATKPPQERFSLWSGVEESVVYGEKTAFLSAHQYKDAVYPQGFQHLMYVELDPHPRFVYQFGGMVWEKEIQMLPGRNRTEITYRYLSGPYGEAELQVSPLITCRHYHHTARAAHLHFLQKVSADGVVVKAYGDVPELRLAISQGNYHKAEAWYYDFLYPAEAARGLDCVEDLYRPGRFTVSLKPGETVVVSAEAGENKRKPVPLVAANDKLPEKKDGFLDMLIRAAGQFIVQRPESRQYTVIAGYPWFTDWGRDTMIALPGLCLTTGWFDVARGLLSTFADHVSQGIVPNRFPDYAEDPEYNTVDASLWMFVAVDKYLQQSKDVEFVENLYPVLKDILHWYQVGTYHNIHMDEDALIWAGEPGVQLTWMDAKVGDWVVTPRVGKPVEINALWYNALRTAQGLAERFGDMPGADRYRHLAGKVRESFVKVFQNKTQACLYDVVNGADRDDSVRPNQILAVSLPHPVISGRLAQSVLDVVTEQLLTPLGLRSLSPRDSKYIGRYRGDQLARDGAYHQGTVWGWLFGPYVDAYVNVNGLSKSTTEHVRRLLEPFRIHLLQAGIGSISEIFDGDYPFTAKGCFAQAWSVAEVLRVYVDYVLAPRKG